MAPAPPAEANNGRSDCQRLIEQGEYARAIETCKRAYLAEREPGILYMLALAYRRANDPEDAILYYQEYLEVRGTALSRDARDGIEKLIATERAALAARPNQTKQGRPDEPTPSSTSQPVPSLPAASPGAPVLTGRPVSSSVVSAGPAVPTALSTAPVPPEPTPPAKPDGPRPWYKSVLGDALLIASIGGVMGGGIVLGDGILTGANAKNAGSVVLFNRENATARTLEVTGIGVAAGGAVLVVLGILADFHHSDRPDGASAAEACTTPGLLSVAWCGRF